VAMRVDAWRGVISCLERRFASTAKPWKTKIKVRY
jgi:hypothetical protein